MEVMIPIHAGRRQGSALLSRKPSVSSAVIFKGSVLSLAILLAGGAKIKQDKRQSAKGKRQRGPAACAVRLFPPRGGG
jgi:hypothetical protein